MFKERTKKEGRKEMFYLTTHLTRTKKKKEEKKKRTMERGGGGGGGCDLLPDLPNVPLEHIGGPAIYY